MSQPYNRPVIVPLTVTSDGWVQADGVKVCRYIAERGTLQFVDKDRRTSSTRGTRYVEVSVSDVAKIGKGEGGTGGI